MPFPLLDLVTLPASLSGMGRCAFPGVQEQIFDTQLPVTALSCSVFATLLWVGNKKLVSTIAMPTLQTLQSWVT